MPTYQYACTVASCGHAFDRVQAFSDDALTQCPECSGRLRKVWGSIGVVFKGSGFYRNDSRESAKKQRDGHGGDGNNGDGKNGDGKNATKESKESSSTKASADSSSSASTTPSSDSGGTTKTPAAKSTGDSSSSAKRSPGAAS